MPASGPLSSLRADRAILDALASGQGEWEGAEPQSLSRSRIQKLMEDGNVLADEKPLRAGERPRPGSLVELHLPGPVPLELIPEDRPLDILYQDAHLIVINKPAGLTVHPSETQAQGTLVNVLLHHVRDLSGIGGALRPGIVHRIDKNTSGALVITKTDEAHRRLVETFSRHDIERAYWALCYGSPPDGAGGNPARIETRIGRSPSDRKKMANLEDKGARGRRAVSFYRKLREFGLPRNTPFASWLEVTLETGRTHQVRVHLTGIGHSILGDPVYGTPSERQPKWLALPEEVRAAVQALPGQALHARVLGFTHPVTGEKLRFEAEPPAEYARLLAALSGYLVAAAK